MEKVDTSSNRDDPALFFSQCPAPAAYGQSRIASPLPPQNLVPQLLSSSIPTALRRKNRQSHLASLFARFVKLFPKLPAHHITVGSQSRAA